MFIIESRNEHFTQENGIWYRNGEVWRQCVDKSSGQVIKEKLIKTNHAQVMYDEKYINKGYDLLRYRGVFGKILSFSK